MLTNMIFGFLLGPHRCFLSHLVFLGFFLFVFLGFSFSGFFLLCLPLIAIFLLRFLSF